MYDSRKLQVLPDILILCKQKRPVSHTGLFCCLVFGTINHPQGNSKKQQLLCWISASHLSVCTRVDPRMKYIMRGGFCYNELCLAQQKKIQGCGMPLSLVSNQEQKVAILGNGQPEKPNFLLPSIRRKVVATDETFTAISEKLERPEMAHL